MTDMPILNTEERLFVGRLLGDEAGLGIAINWARRVRENPFPGQISMQLNRHGRYWVPSREWWNRVAA